MSTYQTRKKVWEMYPRQKKEQMQTPRGCKGPTLVRERRLPSGHNTGKLSAESCFSPGLQVLLFCLRVQSSSTAFRGVSLLFYHPHTHPSKTGTKGWKLSCTTPIMPAEVGRKVVFHPKYYPRAPLNQLPYFSHY